MLKLTLTALGAALIATTFVTLWLGIVPIRFTPLPHVNLKTTPNALWIDPFEQIRISSMRLDRKTCKETLIKPYINARALKPNVRKNGCGWVNGFQVYSIGGAKLGNKGAVLSCEMATSMSMWMTHLQKKAKKLFKSRIVKIHHFGTYNCRTIRGSWLPSQHSFANGIDVSGFTLANGKMIRLYGNWKKNTKKAKFMRYAYSKSCTYFMVKLGPGSDKSHQDHFHLDNGPIPSWCSTYTSSFGY